MAKNFLIEQLFLSQSLKKDPIEIDPTYLSFRPNLLASIAKAFHPIISSLYCNFLYPVDNFSIPLATHLSLIYNIPLFISSAKNTFIQPGQTALLIDSSSSFKEIQSCAKKLEDQGLFISDALVLLGSTQKENEIKQKEEITLHNLWDIKTLEKDLNTLLHQNSYSKIH
jgi:hypothetical protein